MNTNKKTGIGIIIWSIVIEAAMLYATEQKSIDYNTLRKQLYENTFCKTELFFAQQEKTLLWNRPITSAILNTVSADTLKNLIILKTVEAEYLYSAKKLCAKYIDKKERFLKQVAIKLKTDHSTIIAYIRKNRQTDLYYYAAEYLFAMIPIFGDGGKVYSMQASRFIRDKLLKTPKDAAAQAHYGIYIAYLISTQRHTKLNNLTTLALQLLSDKNINAIQNPVLQYRAYCYKSAIYMKNLDSTQAYHYYSCAKTIFPATKLQHTGGIYYGNTAEKQEAYRILSFKLDSDIPYYTDVGLYYRNGDFTLLAPYIGAGMKRTFFSSAWFAETGTKIAYKYFNWRIGFMHAFTPDFSIMNPHMLEFYGINTLSLRFPRLVVSTETKIGKMVFARNPLNGQMIKTNATRLFAIKQNIVCNFTIYNDGFNHISGVMNTGIYHIPSEYQTFGYMQLNIPATFSFGHSELGFLPQLTYTDYITKAQNINALTKHNIYRSSILLTQKHSQADNLYYNLYNLTGNFDCTYRIFLTPFKAPADRLYAGIHSSIGFGINRQSNQTDILYASGLSLGFQLYDLRPFELRFQIDQNYNIFFMMTILNPIRHKK